MQAMAARTFGALKIAIKSLEALYSAPNPSLTHNDSSTECPYPRHYIDVSGCRKPFWYEVYDLRSRLTFLGLTESGTKICIRFVKKYSPEAHRFSASYGHVPELLAHERLLGGWYMVVMGVLKMGKHHDDDDNSDDRFSPRTTGSYRQFSQMAVVNRQPLGKPVTNFIHELHAHGYVHGDLRGVN